MKQREFQCTVWSDGYKWVSAEVTLLARYGLPSNVGSEYRPEPCLIHPSQEDHTYEQACELYKPRDYNPLGVPGLYRTFAAVQATEAGVLEFVERYGMLGEVGAAEDIGRCEPLSLWRHEIAAVARALALWEWTNAPDKVQKAKFVWSKENPTVYELELSGRRSGNDINHLPQLKTVKRGKEAWLLRHHLLAEVSGRIRDRVWADLNIDPTNITFETFYRAKSLLGAMWLQLFQDLAGDAVWKRCAVCGRFLKRTGVRADAQYCGATCRKAAQRERQAQELL